MGWAIAIGVVLVLVAVSLGLRRHAESPNPQLGWDATEEVFRDPSTDRIMRVWVDHADGSRHYVPE